MDKLLEKITEAVIDTDEGDAAELAQEALDAGINVFTIVDALTAGMDELGRQFENLECFFDAKAEETEFENWFVCRNA